MYPYTFVQWILFFYCYCFLGWCIESSIVSFKQKRLVNRGFLHGPMLPIYGSGAIMVLICTIPVKEHVALVYFFGMIGATLLEYITGYAMEKILKVRYWDYSNRFMNLNGHICFVSSLFWGVLSIFMTYVVHGNVEKIILEIPKNIAFGIVVVITIVFGVDFYDSIKSALDLANLLKQVQKMRLELAVLATILKEEAVDNLKEKSVFLLENMKERSSEILDTIKEKIPEEFNHQEILEQLQTIQGKRVTEIAKRMKALQSEKAEMLKHIGTKGINFLHKYPRANSISLKGTFEEVKVTIEEKIMEKNKRREEK